jgi:hypothetical protein
VVQALVLADSPALRLVLVNKDQLGYRHERQSVRLLTEPGRVLLAVLPPGQQLHRAWARRFAGDVRVGNLSQ